MMVGPFQEADGAVSMRRIEAAWFAIFAVLFAWFALPYTASGWIVFLPSLGFAAFSVLLLLFTTWEEIKGLIAAYKGKE